MTSPIDVAALRAALRAEEDSQVAEHRAAVASLSRRALQQRGVALVGLAVESRRTGLSGRAVLTLSRPEGALPPHVLRPGDAVTLHSGSWEGAGLVHRAGPDALVVGLRDEGGQGAPEGGAPWAAVRAANDVTFRRMHAALERYERERGGHPLVGHVDDVLSGRTDLTDLNLDLQDNTADLSALNTDQRRAVCGAVGSRLFLIHGPPGTGKTATLVEVIRRLVHKRVDGRQPRILVCGPSNLSVDNVLERCAARIAELDGRMTRVGETSRVLPAVEAYALESRIANSDAGDVAASIRREIDDHVAALFGRNARLPFAERRERMAALKALRSDLREREKRTIAELVDGHGCVVFSTLATAGGRTLGDSSFDYVLVDEAGQATVPETLLAALRGTRGLVLAGDHCQLPPTVLSPGGAPLALSLFERLMDAGAPSVMLTQQYRMAAPIAAWSSKAFYGGRLVTSCANWTLAELPNVGRSEETQAQLVFVDTAGTGMAEQVGDGASWQNEGEAALVCRHVAALVSSGVPPSSVVVLAPYSAQVALIAKQLPPGVEAGTVDSMQGRERDAVVYSAVRSNDDRALGFLGERRRTNVALTRARRHLALVGDGETLAAVYADLVDTLYDLADVRYPPAG